MRVDEILFYLDISDEFKSNIVLLRQGVDFTGDGEVGKTIAVIYKKNVKEWGSRKIDILVEQTDIISPLGIIILAITGDLETLNLTTEAAAYIKENRIDDFRQILYSVPSSSFSVSHAEKIRKTNALLEEAA